MQVDDASTNGDVSLFGDVSGVEDVLDMICKKCCRTILEKKHIMTEILFPVSVKNVKPTVSPDSKKGDSIYLHTHEQDNTHIT